MTRLRVVPWRGVGVSEDMIDPLDELASRVGPLVVPIPGYGSYRTNNNSGGTDNGSGHLDCWARTSGGWNGDSRRQFVAVAREVGFEAFYRAPRWWSPVRQRWLEEDWSDHFHLILKDSADLSPGARSQLSQWYEGSNGLAGFYIGQDWRYDPDDGPRTHLRQTWTQYREKDDMPTLKEIWGYPVPLSDSVARLMGKKAGSSWSAQGLLMYGNAAYWDLTRTVRPQLATLRGEVAGLRTAVAGLASSQGVDGPALVAAVTQAAREGAAAGADAAIDELIDGATVTLQA